MVKEIIITFILLVGLIEIGNCQDCPGNYPTYRTEDLVYIYQSFTPESAVKGEIPTGDSLKVLNSNAGNIYGVWKICYQGITGYVKKNELSYVKMQQKPQNDKTGYSKQNTSIGNQNIKRRIEQLEQTVIQLKQQIAQLKQVIGLSKANNDTLIKSKKWKLQENWRKLKKGMSKEKVRQILGKPEDVIVKLLVTNWYYPSELIKGNVTFLDGKVVAWREPLK